MKFTQLPKTVFFLFFLLLLSVPATAQQVIVNSDDWRDVFTGMQYAALQGLDANFVVNTQQGTALSQRLTDDTDVLLITGSTQAMPGFKALIESRGYIVDERRSRDPIETNLDFAEQVDTKKFVVTDDAYGYNAVSLSSYLFTTQSYTLFADSAIVGLLTDLQPESVLLYGHIPSALFDEMQQFSPTIINNQDRFEDNFELTKLLQETSNTQSLILTNGEFFEKQFFFDNVPILFTGRQSVPDEVLDFIREENFRVATMVGNSLAPNARYIKDETGISIFIKFAQGINQQQIALDLFYLPSYNPLLQVTETTYDPLTQTLRVTYQNPGEIATFFRSTLTYAGETLEDEQAIFIEAGSYKTIAYSVSGTAEDVAYTIVYGASPTALELVLQGSVAIQQVTIDDGSKINVVEAVYDPAKGGFFILVENVGDVDTYLLLEAKDVRIGGDRVRIGSEVTRIPTGESREIFLAAELTERDIERNRQLELEAFYGERELSLVLFERFTLPFTVREGGDYLLLVAIGIGVLIVLILFLLLFRRKKKKPHQHHHAMHNYHYHHQHYRR